VQSYYYNKVIVDSTLGLHTVDTLDSTHTVDDLRLYQFDSTSFIHMGQSDGKKKKRLIVQMVANIRSQRYTLQCLRQGVRGFCTGRLQCLRTIAVLKTPDTCAFLHRAEATSLPNSTTLAHPDNCGFFFAPAVCRFLTCWRNPDTLSVCSVLQQGGRGLYWSALVYHKTTSRLNTVLDESDLTDFTIPHNPLTCRGPMSSTAWRAWLMSVSGSTRSTWRQAPLACPLRTGFQLRASSGCATYLNVCCMAGVCLHVVCSLFPGSTQPAWLSTA
jgi:hypothetical protein